MLHLEPAFEFRSTFNAGIYITHADMPTASHNCAIGLSTNYDVPTAMFGEPLKLFPVVRSIELRLAVDRSAHIVDPVRKKVWP